jgi:hypothetical protein
VLTKTGKIRLAKLALPFSSVLQWRAVDLWRLLFGVLLLATLATGWIAWVARHAWRDRERTLRWSAASGGCALAMMLLVALEKV